MRLCLYLHKIGMQVLVTWKTVTLILSKDILYILKIYTFFFMCYPKISRKTRVNLHVLIFMSHRMTAEREWPIQTVTHKVGKRSKYIMKKHQAAVPRIFEKQLVIYFITFADVVWGKRTCSVLVFVLHKFPWPQGKLVLFK